MLRGEECVHVDDERKFEARHALYTVVHACLLNKTEWLSLFHFLAWSAFSIQDIPTFEAHVFKIKHSI